MKRTPLWTQVAIVCHLTSILSPGAWLYFALHTGNVFRWDDFSAENLAVCLLLSILPVVLYFVAFVLQRRHQKPAWGSLLACLFFLLAAAGWLYTLCDSWNLWNAALAADASAQLHALRTAALAGVISALLPLLSQISSALGKK